MKFLVAIVSLVTAATAQSASSTTSESASATSNASASVITSVNFFVGPLAKANATSGYGASWSTQECYERTAYVIRCSDSALCGPTERFTIGNIDSTAQYQTVTTSSDGTRVISFAACNMTQSATTAACAYVESTIISGESTSSTSYTSTISAAYTQLPITALFTPTTSTVCRATGSTGMAALATAHAVYKVLVAPAAAVMALAMV